LRTFTRDSRLSPYTVADPVNVVHTETGAVVDWPIEGTGKGEAFSMNASSTFEIEDGMIIKSTDSYVRSEALWG